MNARFSVYLDLVRFGAAFTVLLSHLAYARFTDGNYRILRDLNIGSDAVVLFFVLSGLVIAYTADTKDRTLGVFAFNRLTRVWSVAVPAVLLTIGLDHLGTQLNPEAYRGWWFAAHSVESMLFFGLTFSTEWGLAPFRLGSNGPYWSLSYEVAYYALFAAVCYLKGGRRALALTIMIPVFGIRPLLLLPCWLIGLHVYRLLRDGFDPGPARAWLLALVPPAIYAISLAIGLPRLLMALQTVVIDVRYVNGLFNFSNEFLWNNLLGLLAAAHFLGAAVVLRSWRHGFSPRVERAIRWLAGGSFSLYLLHYPVLQFTEAVLPEWPQAIRHPALLLICLFACYLGAELFERRLAGFRSLVRHLAIWRRASQPVVG